MQLVKKYIWYILIPLVFVGWQFVAGNILGGFEGTDDQSVALIQEIAPSFEPNAKPVFELESNLAETLLFTFQSLIGLGVIITVFIISKKLGATKSKAE